MLNRATTAITRSSRRIKPTSLIGSTIQTCPRIGETDESKYLAPCLIVSKRWMSDMPTTSPESTTQPIPSTTTTSPLPSKSVPPTSAKIKYDVDEDEEDEKDAKGRYAVRTAVDRRGMYKVGKDPYKDDWERRNKLSEEGVKEHGLPPPVSKPGKSPLTPLVSELHEQIYVRGPLTIAEYMQHALGHPKHGYYMQREAIGKEGDFVTSPELTPIFGEMIGMWCLTTWIRIGKPSKFQLVELGPGRGTLMKDVLSAAACFPEFMKALSVHFVENSVNMRESQLSTLGGTLDDRLEDNKLMTDGVLDEETAKDKPMSLPLVSAKIKYDTIAKYNTEYNEDTSNTNTNETNKWQPQQRKPPIFNVGPNNFTNQESINVRWHWTLGDIPPTLPVIIISNEFLDALPVHQFKLTERGWREILVDMDRSDEGKHHLRYVLSPEPTPASLAYAFPIHEFGGSDPVPTTNTTSSGIHDNNNNNNSTIDNKSTMTHQATPSSTTSIGGPTTTSKGKSRVLLSENDIVNESKSTSGQSKGILLPDGTYSKSSATSTYTPTLGTVTESFDPKKRSTAYTPNNIDTNITSNISSSHNNVNSTTNELTKDEVERRANALLDLSQGPTLGDTYEVSPAAFVWMEQVTLRIMQNGGAALFIDYGDNDTGFILDNRSDFNEDDQNTSTNNSNTSNNVGNRASSPSSSSSSHPSPSKSRISRPLSLMGVKKHTHADALSEPGFVDLSTHVNFGALAAVVRRTNNQLIKMLSMDKSSPEYKKALEVLSKAGRRKIRQAPNETGTSSGSPGSDSSSIPQPIVHGVDVYPAITQSALLQQLGIELRFEKVLAKAKSMEEAQALFGAVNRLVDPSQMGTLFKAMAIMQKGCTPPIGWSGMYDDDLKLNHKVTDHRRDQSSQLFDSDEKKN